MSVFWSILVVLCMVIGPRLMVSLSKRVRILGMLGPVFLCYAAGILLSLVIPETQIAMDLSEILVPIAIPLILFSADLSSVKRLAKPMLVSFLLVVASVILVACASFTIYRNLIPDAYKYAGMLIGLYTGGTPNLMAIGSALGVSDSHIVLANAADVVVGGTYFLLLISVMPRFSRRFLKPFTSSNTDADASDIEHLEKNFVPDKEPFSMRTIIRHIPVVLLGILSLGIAAGLALLLTGTLNVVVIMLVVTTCGIGFSFLKKVRSAPGSYTVGQYLILMFSFGIGLSFNFSSLNKQALLLLAMFATAQFGSVLIHALLSKLFRIDADTALITSTAGIYGPAFIVPVADAMGNREVILPGLICGIFGYAIGNYLGIGVALALKTIGG
ncbi:MAG: DUF819 family protein [Eubacteriales bacterium]|nr:DUF819 family protein [Eubacteriales bacterium]